MKRIVALTLALGAFAGPALAQGRAYESAVAALPRPEAIEPDLSALIERLRAAVAAGEAKSIDAELAPDFRTWDCFLDPTKACVRRDAADPRRQKRYLALKPGQRIREDLCCRDIAPGRITPKLRDEATLGAIGAALEDETLGVSPFDPAHLCAPAPPHFDRAAAARLAQRAEVEGEELRLAARALTLRERPAKEAAEIGVIAPLSIAPLATAGDHALPDGWSGFVLPDGRVGYTQDLGANELSYAGLCFARDSGGRWRIVAAVERKP
ncbi:MAG: hypothetical protein JNK46_18220 [Methylobacteriaceae bacterium]|nr:hypothetical protein [Methylobacteriaceae bacterium]